VLPLPPTVTLAAVVPPQAEAERRMNKEQFMTVMAQAYNPSLDGSNSVGAILVRPRQTTADI
jgi:hypothetical protein